MTSLSKPAHGHSTARRLSMELARQAHLGRSRTAALALASADKRRTAWMLKAAREFLRDGDRKRMGVALVALVLCSLSNLSFPTIVGRTLDDAGRAKLLGLACAVFGVGAVASFTRTFLVNCVAHSIEQKMRKRLYEALLKKDLSFFTEGNASAISTRLLDDTSLIAKTLTHSSVDLLRSCSSLIGGSSMLLALSPKLTLVTVSLVPLIGLGGMFVAKKARKVTQQMKKELESTIGSAEEKLQDLRTVRLFATEEYEMSSFNKRLKKLQQMARKAAVYDGLLMGVLTFATSMTMASLLHFGSILIKNKEISVGNMTSFVLYSSMVGLGTSKLSASFSDWTKASVSSERIYELLGTEGAKPVKVSGAAFASKVEETLKQKGAAAPVSSSTSTLASEDDVMKVMLPEVRGEIVFDDVHFSYPSRPDVEVLKGLSFVVAPGQVIAVAGASGAGKTSIANALLGLYPIKSGKILIDGHDIGRLDMRWLRRKVYSAVDQEPALFLGSVAENIAYGRDSVDFAEIEEAAKKADAHEFIMELSDGYNTEVGCRGTQLSVGQKQRIAIARAVLRDTPILILDEATSALDIESERTVQAALSALMKGRTTLMIAHRPEALKHATRILVLNDHGVVAESGSYDELMAKKGGLLATLQCAEGNLKFGAETVAVQ